MALVQRGTLVPMNMVSTEPTGMRHVNPWVAGRKKNFIGCTNKKSRRKFHGVDACRLCYRPKRFHRFGRLFLVAFSPVAWSVVGSPHRFEVLPNGPTNGAVDSPVLAGDTLVTAKPMYAGQPGQILIRHRIGADWSDPQVLLSANTSFYFAADSERITVFYRDDSNRVDIYKRTGSAWTVEQSIANALNGVSTHETVRDITIAGNIMVVGRGTVVFQRDPLSAQWSRVNEPFNIPAGVNRILATDGARVATCSSGACRSRLLLPAGGWQDEAESGTIGPSLGFAMAVAGEWLYASNSEGTVSVLQRVGSQWQFRQFLPGRVDSLVAEGNRILTGRQFEAGAANLLQTDVGGTWSVVASFEGTTPQLPSLSGDWIALGGRTFHFDGTDWEWAGYVERHPTSGSVFLGAQIVPVVGGVWISGPGSFVSDERSGGIWRLATGASSLNPIPVGPAGPAYREGFGSAMAGDSNRIAVLSMGSLMGEADAPDRLTLLSGSSGAVLPGFILLASYSTPPPDVYRPSSESVSIEGDVVVVGRERIPSTGITEVEVVVYTVDAAGTTALVQIIRSGHAVPNPSYDLLAIPGANTELKDGWLMAGNKQYKRAATGQFDLVGDLTVPGGLSAGSEVLWRDTHRDGVTMVIPVRGDAAVVGLVYQLDANAGWTFFGRVYGGGRASECLLAISGDRVACYAGAGGMHFGDRQVTGDSWILSESTTLPIAPVGIELGYRPATLRFSASTWYLGLPRIAHYAFALPGMVIAIPDGNVLLKSGFD